MDQQQQQQQQQHADHMPILSMPGSYSSSSSMQSSSTRTSVHEAVIAAAAKVKAQAQVGGLGSGAAGKLPAPGGLINPGFGGGGAGGGLGPRISPAGADTVPAGRGGYDDDQEEEEDDDIININKSNGFSAGNGLQQAGSAAEATAGGGRSSRAQHVDPQGAAELHHHPQHQQQAQQLAAVRPPASSSSPSPVQEGLQRPASKPVRYRECLKNHAANLGGHATDGCGEFMPSGEDGTLEALRCAACSCHRNFHRRDVEGEPADCRGECGAGLLYGGKRWDSLFSPLALPAPGPDVVYGGRGAVAPTYLPPPPPPPQMLMPPYPPFDSDPEYDAAARPGALHVASHQAPGRGLMMKKRFRTKFTPEQKEHMHAFAQKVGWRLQKQDEAAVQRFCAHVGVKRHVLKVWMHNNKHTLGKLRPSPTPTSATTPPVILSSPGPHSGAAAPAAAAISPDADHSLAIDDDDVDDDDVDDEEDAAARV